MNRPNSVILGLAYILGLLSTGLVDFSPQLNRWQEVVIRIVILSLITLLTTIFIRRFWWQSPPRKIWLMGGLIAIFAVVYLEIRTPYPSANDISNLLKNNVVNSIKITGNIISEIRLNRRENLQFWLEVKEFTLKNLPTEKSAGKLYVTLPNLAENQVYPGQEITIKGLLYRPRRANNPSAFDFASYLARQGAFAGLKGEIIIDKKSPTWGVWQIRQRIVEAQIQGIGQEKGTLLSSITLGRQAVNLPAKITDLFIKTGLAHILAASGFHVAILLGFVLTITRNLSPKQQFIIAITILIVYGTLTGLQPSVLRAILMGIGALIGLLYNRQVNSLGSLLLAATILLLWQPLWIWDLGFQLSFLATLGLIITVPLLKNKIDYFPNLIAEPIAISLAATLWTMPLLMFTFNSIALYSIPINIITTPLVTLISLGGVFTAFLGLIYPPLGSISASILYYPLELLLQITTFFSLLPFSTYSTGKLSLGVMLIIYICLTLICFNIWFRQRWHLIGLFILTLILIPIIYQHLTLTQVTVLATKSQPVIIIQNRGNTLLINGEEPATARYTVLPFLRQEGINQIQGAITVNNSAQFSTISESIPIKKTLNLSQSEKFNLGEITGQLLEKNLFKFQVKNQSWLWIVNPKIPVNLSQEFSPLVLLWQGSNLDKQWLESIRPQTAIAVTTNLSRNVRNQLRKAGIKTYWTGRDGAIQWTAKNGFQPFLINE
ncbi:MAG: ComEC/Rec2 family competence protein [Microcystis sp. M038S2]|uniref:ComEC/Rec2 family competence protein n=1 Tax=unclassified Microcystis TaxID=2643300 RepID=UPI0011923494|nr:MULTISPECIES: ComEC/Rec2 family competence protein [unclassified Microcystis]TRU55047.1 MAG: ComEC/Rec2 family competence protein [Microcystis aeruginosa Ma_QC_C_20070823_S13D]TRU61335.1 MAG: ComEC/Rec2 family competence protein [Microcystis aeruginosa Ma_QC_C_20070823_S13]MCA2685210.1 ComEC/Rec2 family competence protein [Microcystis sp. M046S2]MCA2703519.1 ComEC/Rec2 family competence protein [Microcystis sp. M038S2]MCA2948349.1 ComEC/Rec2 family competence protein [Microcystis sp. M109S1